MKNIDKYSYAELLNKLGIPVQEDEDGDFIVLQQGDADFPHDVVVYITVNNNKLSYHAGAPGWSPDCSLLSEANRFNCDHIAPTAVVRGSSLCMEVHFLLDEEVSEEYVKSNCILFPLSSIWHAFMDIHRQVKK